MEPEGASSPPVQVQVVTYSGSGELKPFRYGNRKVLLTQPSGFFFSPHLWSRRMTLRVVCNRLGHDLNSAGATWLVVMIDDSDSSLQKKKNIQIGKT